MNPTLLRTKTQRYYVDVQPLVERLFLLRLPRCPR